jgi:hypothetical protein
MGFCEGSPVAFRRGAPAPERRRGPANRSSPSFAGDPYSPISQFWIRPIKAGGISVTFATVRSGSSLKDAHRPPAEQSRGPYVVIEPVADHHRLGCSASRVPQCRRARSNIAGSGFSRPTSADATPSISALVLMQIFFAGCRLADSTATDHPRATRFDPEPTLDSRRATVWLRG